MMEEDQSPENAVYKTDLKWAVENEPDKTEHKNRIEAFCRQLVWMFKNKVISNKGKIDFKIVLTFPNTMSEQTKGICLDFWKEGVNKLMGLGQGGWTQKNDIRIEKKSGINIIEQSESVVPYYSFVRSEVKPSQDAINVDIGGGTSDMLFIINSACPQKGKRYYTSSLFAGNDLWGDGTSAFPQKNNGFYQLVQLKIDDGTVKIPTGPDSDDIDLGKCYDTFKKMATSSADIISFMFKYDKIFNISAAIQSNPQLYPLVFIHFSALLYYIAKVINHNDLPLPSYLSFTGMGSKYLGLISYKPDTIAAYARLLLEKFTGKNTPESFRVIFAASPKEITAEGGLMSQNAQILREPINPTQLKEYGFESQKEIYRYREVLNAKEAVLDEFNTFIELLSEDDVSLHLSDKHKVDLTDAINALKKHVRVSYEEVYEQKKILGDNAIVNDALFFWPLKNAIYEVSKELWDQQ